MSTVWHHILSTGAPRSVVVIRLMVGVVFLSEGIQDFLFPAGLGAGRFERIGIPIPAITGPFVGVVETVWSVDSRGTADQTCRPPAPRQHVGSHSLDQGSDPAGPRLLGISVARSLQVRILEHGPRGTNGFLYVAGIAVSADTRSRAVVLGCSNRRLPRRQYCAARSRRHEQTGRSAGGTWLGIVALFEAEPTIDGYVCEADGTLFGCDKGGRETDENWDIE